MNKLFISIFFIHFFLFLYPFIVFFAVFPRDLSRECFVCLFVCLVSLFNGISTLFRLFNAKAILLEEQYWYYLTHSWEDKGVHIFPKGICPKVNVIARLEYELTYYDSAVHRFNHYTTRTPPFYVCSTWYSQAVFVCLLFFLIIDIG